MPVRYAADGITWTNIMCTKALDSGGYQINTDVLSESAGDATTTYTNIQGIIYGSREKLNWRRWNALDGL